MLYRYNGKVYIKPFSDKLVEVTVNKKGNAYDVKPTQRTVIITPEISGKLLSISIEEAYKMQNKTSFKED